MMEATHRNNSKEEKTVKSEDKNTSLASDGPVSKAEGTDSPDLDENDTSKSFDRDQEELNYGFHDGDLDTMPESDKPQE